MVLDVSFVHETVRPPHIRVLPALKLPYWSSPDEVRQIHLLQKNTSQEPMYSYVRQNVLFAFSTLLPAIATTQNITPSTPSLDQYNYTAVSCSSQGLSAYCIAGGACCADNTCCGVGLQCVSDSSTGGYGCEASKPSSGVNAPSSVSFLLFLSFIISQSKLKRSRMPRES